jgi:hypothetical protein
VNNTCVDCTLEGSAMSVLCNNNRTVNLIKLEMEQADEKLLSEGEKPGYVYLYANLVVRS